MEALGGLERDAWTTSGESRRQQVSLNKREGILSLAQVASPASFPCGNRRSPLLALISAKARSCFALCSKLRGQSVLRGLALISLNSSPEMWYDISVSPRRDRRDRCIRNVSSVSLNGAATWRVCSRGSGLFKVLGGGGGGGPPGPACVAAAFGSSAASRRSQRNQLLWQAGHVRGKFGVFCL